MAKKYLIGINLNRNELQNAVIQPLASAPSSPTAGLIYFDTTLDKFGVYDGTQWVYMGDFDGSDYVDITTNQTIGGIKTFTSFPVTPSSAPSTDYQVANKKYVDDAVTAGGGYTDEDAQDAVGSILTDTATIDFDYDDAANTIEANVLDSPLLQGQNSAYHRNRANHTGTQTASTISDFDTEVSNNTDVAANTAARHTHSNKTILDNTTASFTTADETKLDNITVTQPVDLDALETAVSALDSAVILKGSWAANASTFPGSGAAQAGWSYIVSTAGTVNGQTFAVGDRIIAITDNASTSTFAGNWFKADYTDQVLSVNSQTGAVVLTTANIADSSNKRYVTDAQLTVLGNTSGINTGDEPTATTTAEGVVELATQVEAQTKTSTDRALTPASVADFARKYTGTIGNGSATSIAVTHGLGSQYVTAQAFDATTNELVECDITLTNSTQTTFGFSIAPTTNAIRVVITG